jgi:hypothetical protein
MPNATATQPPANLTFQGIVVPGSALNPKAFFQGTRRQRVLQKSIGSWQGFGNTDIVDTLRAGILAGYYVKLSGALHVTPGSGTVATTARWPYYVLRNGRFQANGQSNLIQSTGWFLRARELVTNDDLNDRGVVEGIGGASPGTQRTQGTMALSSESWGVGSNVTAIATGTYTVELSFFVPVAYEMKMLTGAVFCQTMSTTLELDLTWANKSDLFTLTGNGAVTFTPAVTVEAVMFTIPSDGKGGMVLPNLSAFHSYVVNRAPNNISQGNNEVFLAGQGVGRQLQRILWRTQKTAVPTPVIPTAANVTSPYWKYGTNTIPEQWLDGQVLRHDNERDCGSDVGAFAGFEVIDFDKTWGFRDSVNMGSATELRFGYTLVNALTSPFCEYAQDVMLAGAAA